MTRPAGSRFGKHDKTGRSSGKLQGKWRNMVNRPPEGEPFIFLTRELLTSDAWKAQSLLCRRFIDFLHIEHMNHAGTMNGRLMATYDQLHKAGIPRKKVNSVIAEAEALGLLRVDRGGLWWKPHKANFYTLTYYAVDDVPAKNLWKTPNLKAANVAIASRSKSFPGIPRGSLNSVPSGGNRADKSPDAGSPKSGSFENGSGYPPGVTPFISSPALPDSPTRPNLSKKPPWTKPTFVEHLL